MSSFEDAIAHSRQHDIVSPSPATRGTLGGAPGPGQRSDSSSSFQAGETNSTANPKGQLVPTYPNAPGGALGMSSELGGTDNQAYTPGGEFYAANSASCSDGCDIVNNWPDAQGGALATTKKS